MKVSLTAEARVRAELAVLWEDQRSADMKGFGPHELLLSSVADDLCIDLDRHSEQRIFLKNAVLCVPKKGNGSLLAALKKDLQRLPARVVAVIDRDKAHKLWKDVLPPPSCMQGLREQFGRSAPGAYDLVFLIENTEHLLDAVLESLGQARLDSKPSPDERDRILGRASWAAGSVRNSVRKHCPSFDRLVKIVAGHVSQR